MPQPKPPHNCYVLQPKHSHDASSGLWGNRLGTVHKHHHPSYTKNTRCGGKKGKKSVCVTTRLDRGELTVMLFITPIASFCLCKAWVRFCTLKVIQLALQHLIRSVCHREADESVCKLLQVKAWNISIKPLNVLNIGFKAAPKEWVMDLNIPVCI